MKKIKIILSILILNICICTCVNATSFNLVSDKEKIEVSAGDTAEFNISLEDIDMNSKGINVVEGYIKYDEEIIEKLEIINQNGWKMTYNNDKNSNLYGKFLSLKDSDGTVKNEIIAKIKVKIKDNISKESGEIKIQEITSNDGENLVNIGDKVINLIVRGPKQEDNKTNENLDNDNKQNKENEGNEQLKESVKTGDNVLPIMTGIIMLVIAANIFLKDKRKRRNKNAKTFSK